jgi:hypothetical protein
MAITLKGTNSDRITRRGPGKSLFEDGKSVAAAQTWNQGDLMCYDATLNTNLGGIRPVAATGDGATFIGIADNAVTGGKLVGPYTGLTQTDASEVGPGFVGPKYGVEADMDLVTGDAWIMGQKAYLANGGTSQQVTSVPTGDSNYVGIFVDPQGAITSAAAGQVGRILLGCRYPGATGAVLQF